MNKGTHTKREIQQQPEVWKKTLKRMEEVKPKILERFDETDYEKIVFFGSGTSYFLAQTAAATMQRFNDIETKAAPSSEIFLFPQTYFRVENPKKTLCCSFSRSGKTSETVRATRFVKNNIGLSSCTFTCYGKSRLADISDFKITFPEAKEDSVVMTKSFTSMLIGVIEVAASLNKDKNVSGSTDSLPQLGEEVINNYWKLVGKIFQNKSFDRFVFLGGGPLYGIASESMLKMKEMALTTTEVFHPLEYRHGPKSTADQDTLIILYISDSGYEQEIELIPELNELEANVVTIGQGLGTLVKKDSDYFTELGTNLGEFFRTPLYMPFAQILGFELASKKGLNTDSPQNLTQVVELTDD